MITRKRLAAATAVLLVGLLAAGAAMVVRQSFFRPITITAYFTTATSIYPGDDVKVAGIKVGRITSIRAQGTQAAITMTVDHGVPIPTDAKAVIVAQNLIAARYVQLAPAYLTAGPTMPDGAVIPIQRTAIPVEWDEVKQQLMRLATDLGPSSNLSGTATGRFIDSAADAMGGNGDKLRQTLAQLSTVGRVLADGSGNIVDVIENLQIFVTALRDSGTQMVQFQNRLATLSGVLDDSKSDLDDLLTRLSVAVGDVQRFISGTRDNTSEQIQRLANVTQTLADHQMDVQNILHVMPTAFANGYGIYNPDTGSPIGNFVFTNLSNPLLFICSSIGAIENTTATETGKLCSDYLGPAIRLLNANNIPLPINPYLAKQADPQNVLYSEPGLMPGGDGGSPAPPEGPPAVSAYAGSAGDTPATPPTPPSLPDLLFPAEALAPANSGPVPPAPEGTPPS